MFKKIHLNKLSFTLLKRTKIYKLSNIFIKDKFINIC